MNTISREVWEQLLPNLTFNVVTRRRYDDYTNIPTEEYEVGIRVIAGTAFLLKPDIHVIFTGDDWEAGLRKAMAEVTDYVIKSAQLLDKAAQESRR